MKLPATLRAWQGRGQVPWAWIAACLARGVKARCTVGLVQSRRWRGAPHQGTAPRQPLKYTKASSHPWSGSFTILLFVFLHPKPWLMLLVFLGSAVHSLVSQELQHSSFIHFYFNSSSFSRITQYVLNTISFHVCNFTPIIITSNRLMFLMSNTATEVSCRQTVTTAVALLELQSLT